MNLVDYVYLKPALGRSEPSVFAQFPNAINPRVRRGVHLDQVQTRPVDNLATRRAFTARVRRRPFLAVQRSGHNTGRRRFTDSARTYKQVCVPFPVSFYSITQRRGDMFLSHNILEPNRPVFSR